MDNFGFLKDYLEDNNCEDDVPVHNSGIDYEYNWHPVFLTQESREEKLVVADKHADNLDFSELFREEESGSTSNIPYEPMIFNQKMLEIVGKDDCKVVEKYNPIVEAISDSETDNCDGHDDGLR